MAYVFSILLVIFCPLSFFNLLQAVEMNKEAIPAVIAFGDSILDTGNNNYLPTVSKCNFPPYGRSFPGGIPTGRFSDGKVFSDLIAEGLGIKATLPAYLDPQVQDYDLPSGVCFASGGSGLDPVTASIQSILSIEHQFNLFKEYIWRLKRIVGEVKANEIISKSQFLISSGNNDIGITYYGLHLRHKYDISTYTSLLVRMASKLVQDLYELGARRIAFLGTLPLGCLPIERTLLGGLFRECGGTVNRAAQMFNSKLSYQLSKFDKSLPNSTIFYIDIYNPLLAIIRNPRASGFEVAKNGCCGTGLVEVLSVTCNEFNPFTCHETFKYVFWDSAHPSERAYRIIVSQILKKYAKYFS